MEYKKIYLVRSPLDLNATTLSTILKVHRHVFFSYFKVCHISYWLSMYNSILDYNQMARHLKTRTFILLSTSMDHHRGSIRFSHTWRHKSSVFAVPGLRHKTQDSNCREKVIGKNRRLEQLTCTKRRQENIQEQEMDISS